MYFDANRGIDYKLLVRGSEHYHALREVSPIPLTFPAPAKQEVGVVNLIIPVHNLTDNKVLTAFVKRMDEFQSQATGSVKRSQGIVLHLPYIGGDTLSKGELAIKM